MKTPDYTPTIPEMLKRAAADHDEHEALVRGDQRLTFRGLERESALLARALLARGLKKGSRVGIMMPNSPNFMIAFMAVTRIGAIAVPLSTLYQAPELRWVLRFSDIDTLLIYDRYLRHDYLARLEDAFPPLKEQPKRAIALADAPYLRAIYVWGEGERPWAERGPDTLMEAAHTIGRIDEHFLAAVEGNVVPADILFIIFTSGSSGTPKGVVHCHGNVIRHTYRMSHEYSLLAPGERLANARPFFWVAGLTSGFLYGMHAGACHVVMESEDPVRGAALIESEKVTQFSAMAPLLASLRGELVRQESSYTLIPISNNTAGVARIDGLTGEPRFISERLEQIAPARTMDKPTRKFASFYGMTETLAANTAEPLPQLLPDGKEGSSGRPMPGVKHKIIDPVTNKVLPANSEGELLVRGYSLMAGLYKKEREETFEKNGFYRTGDICIADEEGYLTVKGRRDGMVKIHGANVALLEVERAVAAIPGVQEVAVLALPLSADQLMLVASIIPVPTHTLSEQDIIAHLRTQLSSYKVPKRVLFFTYEAIPRTGSGKIDRRQLRMLVQTQLS